MSDTEAIKTLHKMLKRTNKWYIDGYAPDIPELQTICETAKSYANDKLTNISLRSLLSLYKKWLRSEHIEDKSEYFSGFLSDIVFDFGLKALKGKEKQWYMESCNLTLHFI